MNAEQAEKRRRKRNLTMAIKVNIRKDEDREKLMRAIHSSIRKAGRLGTVQIFINDRLEDETVPQKTKSAPKRNHQPQTGLDESLLA